MKAPSLGLSPRAVNRVRFAAILGVLGPGLVSGFADNDAGGITTYSVAGVKYGYELLWVLLASQIVLFFTQEVGARLGLATGQGLTGLVRERFGVRWVTFLTITMLIANIGSIVAEFAGTAAALSLFDVPPAISAAIAATVVILLITRGSFGKVQYLFVAVGIGVSLAYFASALMSHPDWGKAFHSLVVPGGSSNGAYWLAVVATVGTTITPWGQAFIQSYVRGQAPRAGGSHRRAAGRGARRASHEPDRGLHRGRVRRGAVVARQGHRHEQPQRRCRYRQRARRRSPATEPRSCSPWACWRRRSLDSA